MSFNVTNNAAFSGYTKLLGGLRYAEVSVTAATATITVAAATLVRVNFAGAVAITLSNTGAAAGSKVVFKDTSGAASANPITITPSSGTIDGAASLTINADYGFAGLEFDGTNWSLLEHTETFGGIGTLTVSAAGASTVDCTLYGTVLVTSATTAVTINLTNSRRGKQITVVDASGNAYAGQITIRDTTHPAATFGTFYNNAPATSLVIMAKYGAVTLEFDGTNWKLISSVNNQLIIQGEYSAMGAGPTGGIVLQNVAGTGASPALHMRTTPSLNLPNDTTARNQVVSWQSATAIGAWAVMARDAALGSVPGKFAIDTTFRYAHVDGGLAFSTFDPDGRPNPITTVTIDPTTSYIIPSTSIEMRGATFYGNNGGTGNNLTLSSVVGTPKGKILFGTSAYDELNNRLGVGTASPGQRLEVYNGVSLLNRANLNFTQEAGAGAPTVALGAAGVLTGVYSYKVTFVTAAGETAAGTASANISPAAQQVSLTAIPLGTAAVTSRKIYRTAAGGGTYLLVTTIADNTTTVYTDNLADGSLGAAAPFLNTTAGIYQLAGLQSVVTDPGGAVAIGYNTVLTAQNQFVVGGSAGVNDGYFGNGVTNASPAAFTLNASGGSGTNIAGAILTLACGKGTGNASGSAINFSTPDVGAAGTVLQTLSTKLSVNQAGLITTTKGTFQSSVVDAVNAVAYSFNTNSLVSGGTRLLALYNNSANRLFVDALGIASSGQNAAKYTADSFVPMQVSTGGLGTDAGYFGAMKNGAYGLLVGYEERATAAGGVGGKLRMITTDPLAVVVNGSTYVLGFTSDGKLTSGYADGASAIGFTLNTPSYVTAGALLLQLQNNAVAKYSVNKDGTWTLGQIAVFDTGNNRLALAITSNTNTSFGAYALNSLSTGVQNTVYGQIAGNAITSGNYNTFVGYQAGANAATVEYNVGIGYQALFSLAAGGAGTANNIGIGRGGGFNITTGYNNMAIGTNALYGVSTGAANVAVGTSAGTQNNGFYTVSIGYNTGALTGASTFNSSIAIGTDALFTASNQLVIGGNNATYTTQITDAYIGSGVTNATPASVTLNASGGSGTNIAGAAFSLAGGKATGNAVGGAINFQTSDAGATGATLQTLSTKLSVNQAGVVTFTKGSLLSGVADGATAIGFLSNTPSYVTAGAKLASWQNNSVEKGSLDKDGNEQILGYFRAGATSAPSNTTSGDINGLRLYVGADAAIASGYTAQVVGLEKVRGHNDGGSLYLLATGEKYIVPTGALFLGYYAFQLDGDFQLDGESAIMF